MKLKLNEGVLRKAILSVLGVLLLLMSIALVRFYFPEEQKKTIKEDKVQNVYVDTVTNTDNPTFVYASGQLVARERVMLTSEVTGVLKSGKFREGVTYQKGEVMLQIDGTETGANVMSQRSTFYRQLLAIMPDLKLDYSEVFPKWEAYLNSIDLEKPLPRFPQFTNEKEKNFVTGQGLVAAYQTVQNQQIRQDKFLIRAPFSGVVTSANVQRGQLVVTGQSIGELSATGDYELQLSINIQHAQLLSTGKKVELTVEGSTQKWEGKILRINPKANVSTQSITAFVEVKSQELQEGTFMHALLQGNPIENSYELPRKLLTSTNEIYYVTDSLTLETMATTPQFFNDKTAIVTGIPNGTRILSKSLPSAYSGMKVRILNAQ